LIGSISAPEAALLKVAQPLLHRLGASLLARRLVLKAAIIFYPLVGSITASEAALLKVAQDLIQQLEASLLARRLF